MKTLKHKCKDKLCISSLLELRYSSPGKEDETAAARHTVRTVNNPQESTDIEHYDSKDRFSSSKWELQAGGHPLSVSVASVQVE